MNKRITFTRGRYFVVGLLFSTSALFAAENTHSQIKPVIIKKQTQQVFSDSDIHSALREQSKNKMTFLKNRYLIEFNELPLARQPLFKTPKSAKNKASSAQLQRQKKQLAAQQKQHLSRLQGVVPGMKVHSLHQTLLNAAQVQLDAENLALLKAQPEIKTVYPIRMRYLDLDASHQVTQTVAAWEAVGGKSEAGKGVKIAVVDTGIRAENPMFSDSGFEPVDLSQNAHLAENPDYCRSSDGDSSFCNNKLIVARAIDPATHGMEIYANEYHSPQGFDGHGTHVAGIALGNPVAVTFNNAQLDISGVAPGAQLMVYKALYMSDMGVAFGTDTMLLEALELAVLDGADVINNSWGAGSGEDPAASIYNEVFASAEAAGIVVVNAAGNTGHPGATINCPACIESGIAVANTTHGRFIGNPLSVNGKQFLAYQGNNQQLTEPLTLSLKSLNSVSPLDDTGCGAMSGDFFAGSIVLVDYRPFCSLEDVANNIRDGGGEAVLIYQAGAFGMGTYEPFIPFQGNYSIPVFGLSRENGNRIFDDAYRGDYTLTISEQAEQGIEEQYIDIVNPFSSTGPNNDPSVLKPDMAAPGTNILSAYSPDEFVFNPFPGGPGDFPKAKGHSDSEPVFAMLTGTSMASPQVAGAAALLKQQYPQWTPEQIKSALMSTTESHTWIGVDSANAFQQGAGRLDSYAALNAQLRFVRPSWSAPACIGSCSYQNTLVNETTESRQWQLSVEFFDGATTGTVSPENITLSGAGDTHDSQQITITANASRANPDSILFDKWVFGRLTATSSSGKVQHMPLVIYANDTSDEGSLLVSYDGSDLQSQQAITFSSRLRNISSTEQASAVMTAPDNAIFVEGSESVTVKNASTTELQVAEDGKTISWAGQLQSGSMALELQALWDDFSLASAEVQSLPCQEGCNGFVTVVDFDFLFNGDAYQTLTISDNGFVVPGARNIGFFSALFNQHFPQSDNLNNVIAPFWTEFDLLDPNLPGDTGGGQLRAAIRVIDEVNYLVVEWDNVALFSLDEGPEDEFPGDDLPGEDFPGLGAPGEGRVGTASEGFTFQLIIEENSDNIWFNYLHIPSTPAFLTIGAENSDGTIGSSYYFYNELSPALGSIPSSGSALQLKTIEEGKVWIQADVQLQAGQDYGVADSVEVQEDTTLTINVLANDATQTAVSMTSQMSLDQEHKAFATAMIEATGGLDNSSLQVTQEPASGTVTLSDGKLHYVPNADFSGVDELYYRIADGAGKYSADTQVTIRVTPQNDAPELQPISSQTVEEGQQVSVALQASDVDGDPLTFAVEQVAGIIVPLVIDAQGFSFSAPDITQKQTLTFAVVASDGEANSEAQSVTITINEKRSSGGSLYWLLCLMGLAILLRAVSLYIKEIMQNHK